MKTPKYSVCMINLDMEAFLEASILSIANQLDDRFEIVVVDGGSQDRSISILRKMEALLPSLHVFELPRGNRTLGTDRNYSIMVAQGDYVLLHLDCDDLYYPFIKDWVTAFHLIEEVNGGKELLVAGCHINMGKRSFLLKHGPYKDLVFEDRELWTRMNRIGNFVKLKHKDFVTRMPLSIRRKIIKIPKRILIEMTENLEQPQNNVLTYALREAYLFRKRSFIHFLFRIFILPIAIIKARRSKSDVLENNLSVFSSQDSMLREVSLTDLIEKHPNIINKNLFNTKSQSIYFDNKL